MSNSETLHEINVDPVHMVYTGACCSSCFNVSNDLLRCSRCLHAWYCNQDCQRAAFKAHKTFCKTLQFFNGLHNDLPQDLRASDSKSFYMQRINARNLMGKMLGRPLTRLEARAILNEAKCSVCFKTRDLVAPKPLVCCPDCHWGWTCEDHTTQYMKKGHTREVCDTYKLMNQAELWVHSMVKASGKIPSYCPEGPRRPYEPLPQGGWDAYLRWRPGHSFNPAMLAVLTKRLTQPLTAALALEHFYGSNKEADLGKVVVHVVGAGGFELPADPSWEEVIHVGPPGISGIHLDFIGPEVGDVILEESHGLHIDFNVCPKCKPLGHTRSICHHPATYHEFLQRQRQAHKQGKGPAPVKPHLVVAFNSGMHEEERELWRPSLRALIESGVPCAFTAYNKEEAQAGAQMWVSMGGEVTLPVTLNPYKAMDPIMEPMEVDQFYYQNYYYFCGRGLGASSPAAAPSTAKPVPAPSGAGQAQGSQDASSTAGDSSGTGASSVGKTSGEADVSATVAAGTAVKQSIGSGSAAGKAPAGTVSEAMEALHLSSQEPITELL